MDWTSREGVVEILYVVVRKLLIRRISWRVQIKLIVYGIN